MGSPIERMTPAHVPEAPTQASLRAARDASVATDGQAPAEAPQPVAAAPGE